MLGLGEKKPQRYTTKYNYCQRGEIHFKQSKLHLQRTNGNLLAFPYKMHFQLVKIDEQKQKLKTYLEIKMIPKNIDKYFKV